MRLAIGNGRAWPDPRNDDSTARTPGAWVRELLSRRLMTPKDAVVQRGFTTDTCAGPVTAAGDCPRDPRTGIGLSQDGRALVLSVVGGRQSGWSRGTSTCEPATLMESRGAPGAVGMDSGAQRRCGSRASPRGIPS